MSGKPSGEIVLYPRSDGAPALEVRLDGDTVWLTQDQMAELFGKAKSTINEHIKNIFEEGELLPERAMRKFGISEFSTKPTNFYNLDAVLAVGYRVKSPQGTRFRIWATERLREYLVKGFTMDDARLKKLGGGDYWKELLERIRDIRSSEKVLYRQVLDLYATSVDYDPKSDASALFFKNVQNKLHYAAHGHTAAEIIAARADAGKPFMGLLSFSGDRPTKADIAIAKNYLDSGELKRLNALVSAYFDAAEFRAQNRESTHMKDWLAHLDRLVTALEAKTLSGSGKISHEAAIAKAEAEYEKYRAQIASEPSEVEAAYLDTLKRAQRKLEGKKKNSQ
ncbi:MAG: RhuM family protein [Elusimicrobiota bacterium]